LTDYGRRLAERLRPVLAREAFARVFVPAEIGARADRVFNRVCAVGGDVLVFFERARPGRARCALALPSTRRGRYFLLGTAGLCILEYEHNLAEPAIRLWNDDIRHLDRA
jgi:probable phosphoglycerate mutase